MLSQIVPGLQSALTEQVVVHEFSGVRTGKASPSLVENILVEVYGAQMRVRELAGITELNGDSVSRKVAEAVKKANSKIYERTITEVDKQGMGTTASVLIVTGSRYLIGQVGDSRVYLLRDGKLRQLTKDHSYVQEQVDAGFLTPEQARYHPYSNVITRCVGASDNVEPDTYHGEVKTGDVYLVASDGLTGMVMQTPMTLANKRDRSGRAHLHSVRLSISKELPATFRLPGKQPLTEQVFYHLFLNFLNALVKTGVAVCGAGSVQALAGRTESVGSKN